MGWCIKRSDGKYVSAGGLPGDIEFTHDFACSAWWDTEADALWFIGENELEDVQPEDSNGSSPPGNGQPGQP
jgi:hypothetical protein